MQPNSFTCSRCNAPLPPGVTQCPNCGLAFGSPVPAYTPPPPQKKSSWGILAVIAGGGCLLFFIMILAAILFPVFAKARDKARETVSVSNVSQLCLASLQYAQDHDGKLPKMDSQENFKGAISDYIQSNRKTDVFSDPNTKKPYILNSRLSEKNITTIDNPRDMELMRSPGEYGGYVVVGYADGHVKAVPRDQLQ